MNFANITTEENTTKIEDKPEENKIEVENKIEDKPKKIQKMGQLTPQQEIYKTVRNIYNKLDELIEQVNYLGEKSDKEC